ncbi:MAG: nitronate monooxygenase [Alphaproteobacteria bacterium]|nr:nitronate monooxygenase [Alphaproteobacteria bacterium]
MPDSVSDKIAAIKSRMSIPVVSAPMFLVSGPDLVIAACKAGVIGAFPTLNARPIEQLKAWLQRLTAELGSAVSAERKGAPWAANLIVHRSNARAADDLAMVLEFKPEIVITALGTPRDVVDSVHAYGGLVFADVNSMAYAKKALAAGVDGLALVSAGAGGHTGPITPFSFVPAVREIFAGPLIVGGGVVDGRGVRAMEVLGATFANIGTRFIATAESMASDGYRQMLVEATEEDIILSAHFTGVPANYLRPSIVGAGLDPAQLGVRAEKKFDSKGDPKSDNTKAWRDIWSAGQGVRAIKSVQSVADLVAELKAGYDRAKN